MFNHLKDILAEIEERNQNEEILPYEAEFLQQLRNLSSWEKIFLQKRLYACEWQVGSPHLMAVLQQEGLFNISLYLTNLSNADDANNILNDLLEVEHSLLTEIVLSAAMESSQSEKLACLLEKCCETALKDLLKDPSLEIPNYMERLEIHLRDKSDLQHFRKMHLKILASLHESQILEALTKQKEWAEEGVFMRNSSLNALLSQITKMHRECLESLLSSMIKNNFSEWKFSLAIFNFILTSVSQDDRLFVKKFVESFFWKACITRSEQKFQIFLLFIREISYASGEAKKTTYATWYKATISEMTYKIQPEDFRVTIAYLINFTHLEEDMDFLNVHIKTYISAPARCQDIVQEFKQISRIRLNSLTTQTEKLEKVVQVSGDEDCDCVIFID
ncbi:uncharacterized protein LOC129801542 [Phlebotomus papatasi]|uniref:uncharacterized protein LOC129801542 n=1 Tax=Phlebotomus papatasi TaxID=29031 RepID=UPI002483D9C3|nr:uncharacterized protein LOC129801542 [Phlebotomus papatasi]